jgi:hypothetical protein
LNADLTLGYLFSHIDQFDRFDVFSLSHSVRKVADDAKNFKNTVALHHGILIL